MCSTPWLHKNPAKETALAIEEVQLGARTNQRRTALAARRGAVRLGPRTNHRRRLRLQSRNNALAIKEVQYALAPEQIGKVGEVQYALPEQASKGDCIRLLLGISAAGYANRIRLPASDSNATVPELCSAWPYVGGMKLEMTAKGKCSTLVKV